MTIETSNRRPSLGSRGGFNPAHERRHRALVRTEVATGASALVCGALLALRPDGSLMGLPSRVLESGPFTDWRMPGLLLAGLVGGGFLAAGASARWRLPFTRELSVAAGSGLILFEAVEWFWLGFHPLQAVFMGVGAAVVVLAIGAGPSPSTPSGPLGPTRRDVRLYPPPRAGKTLDP